MSTPPDAAITEQNGDYLVAWLRDNYATLTDDEIEATLYPTPPDMAGSTGADGWVNLFPDVVLAHAWWPAPGTMHFGFPM